MVPGNKTYVSAKTYGKKIVVNGNSRLKRVKRNLSKNYFDNGKSFIKSFSVAKTEHMKHYAIPFLKEQKPDIIVMNVGKNYIKYKNKDNVNVNDLADNIISLVLICRDSGVLDVEK